MPQPSIAFTYITSHGLNVADLLRVAPDQYRQEQFARLDA
jgi:hypothetical protein